MIFPVRKAAFALVAAGSLAAGCPHAQTIIEEWPGISAPPPPEVKMVTVQPKTTALLMLDFMNQNCGKRPRCVASVPKVKTLLGKAREQGVTVVYSLIANTTTADVIADVAPREGEPAVQSGPDKFLRTDLERILKDKGIQTVIVIGTAAQGAVLQTGGHAALLGLNVVLPVDGVSAETPYAEQYTAWHFANAPGLANRATITTLDRIRF